MSRMPLQLSVATATQPVPIEVPQLHELISLRAASQLFPKNRRDKHPSLSQVYRWTTTGKHGVVLASWTAGTVRCTTQAAVRQFILDVSAKRLPQRDVSPEEGVRLATLAGERLRRHVFNRSKEARDG